MAVVTLLTDFGTRDPYGGIMKGVILSLSPGTVIVDISHEVEAHDVREGAFLIPEYYPYFPSGTVHVAVVDPTVGSRRRPIAVVKDGHVFIGPDNGIFTLLLMPPFRTYMLEEIPCPRVRRSATFHGRDLFAPAAAEVARGLDPSLLGPPVSDPVFLDGMKAAVYGDRLVGEVIRFDRFGNAITNIDGETVRAFSAGKTIGISLAGLRFPGLSRTYCDGEVTCLVGSNGYIECALYCGNLRATYGIKKGDRVTVTAEGPEGPIT